MAAPGRFLCCLGMCVVLAACGGDDEAGGEPIDYTIDADDGSATLKIPASALPDGVAVDDITVSRVTAADVEGEGDGDFVDTAIYHLEPDGLQLGEGAFLTTEVETPDGYLPIALHVGEGEMEVEGSDEPFTILVDLVEDTSVFYDADLGTAEISIPMRHFSTLFVTWKEDFAFFRATATHASAVVGQKPAVRATITRTGTDFTSGDYPGRRSFNVHYRDYYDTPRWFSYIAGSWFTHFKENEGKKGTLSLRFSLVPDSTFIIGRTGPGFGTDVLEPTRNTAGRPARTPFTEQFTVPNVDYTCSKVGTGHLDFILEVEFTEERELQRAWDPEWRKIADGIMSQSLKVHTSVTCTLADPTTTTTTTTTTLPLDTTTTTTTTSTTTTPPETTTSSTTTSSTTTAAPPTTTAATTTTTTTTTTTMPPPTSKSVSAPLQCPDPSSTRTSWIDVSIPAGATSPTHSVTDGLDCADTEVSSSGTVIAPGTYRVTFETTGGPGAPGGTDSVAVTVSWTNAS